MAILVTGGCGFIGSHLIEFLLQTTDEDIIIFDRLDETSTLKRIDHLRNSDMYWKRIHMYVKDLRQPLHNGFGHMIKNIYPIKTIYHLAASSHVNRSIENPSLFMEDNVIGTTNLLNWWLDTTANLIYISTDEVFGEALPFYSFKEDDALAPSNPYAASKAAAEHLVRSYAYTYGMKAKIVRLTNVIGIRQHPEKFIPLVIKSIMEDKPVKIHTDLSGRGISTRYYLDVRDACQGLVSINDTLFPSLSKEKRNHGIYHLSGYREILNSSIAYTIAKIMRKEVKLQYISQDKDRPNHDMHYRIDDSKTRRFTNWETQYTTEDTLRQITSWYLENPEWLNLDFYES
jgi:dTDP-glucose 4,6-dehydratase